MNLETALDRAEARYLPQRLVGGRFIAYERGPCPRRAGQGAQITGMARSCTVLEPNLSRQP
jgi:hypothetical protein